MNTHKLCQIKNHESEKILGLCLNQLCEKESFFCFLCFQSQHFDHKKECYQFKEILDFLQKLNSNLEITEKETLFWNYQWDLFEFQFKTFFQFKKGEICIKLKFIGKKFFTTHILVKEKRKITQNLIKSLEMQQFENTCEIQKQLKLIYAQQVVGLILANKQVEKFKYIGHKYIDKLQIFSKKNVLIVNQINLKIYKHPHLISKNKEQEVVLSLNNIKKSVELINKTNSKNEYQTNVDQGLILYKQCKFEQAILQFEGAILQNQNDWVAHKYLGQSLHNLGFHLKALESFDKAIQLNQKSFSVFNKKGDSLRQMRRYEESIKCYDEAIKLNPNFSEAINSKGNSLYLMHKFQESIKCYDQVISINPNYNVSYKNKGLSLHQMQQYEEAIKNFDLSISINPNDSNAFNSKGLSLHHLHRNKEALECYDKSIHLNPDNSKAYNNKGLSLFSIQKFDEALKHYNKGIKQSVQTNQIQQHLIIKDNYCFR